MTDFEKELIAQLKEVNKNLFRISTGLSTLYISEMFSNKNMTRTEYAECMSANFNELTEYLSKEDSK